MNVKIFIEQEIASWNRSKYRNKMKAADFPPPA